MVRTLRMPATAAWMVVAQIRAQAGGVITEVVADSGLLTPGDVLLRIDERPVIVLAGEIPAFRELRRGVIGRDVAAVHRYLTRPRLRGRLHFRRFLASHGRGGFSLAGKPG